jgi:AcrR family transcriptional regulator
MKPRVKEIHDTVIKMLFGGVESQKITMSNVATHIGLAKSTIYEYFKSKDDMILSAIKQFLDDYTIYDEDTSDLELGFEEAFKIRIKKLLDKMGVIPFNEGHIMVLMDNVLSTETKLELKTYFLKRQDENFSKFADFCRLGKETGIIKRNVSEFEMKSAYIYLNGILMKYLHTKEFKSFNQDEFISEIYYVMLKILN